MLFLTQLIEKFVLPRSAFYLPHYRATNHLFRFKVRSVSWMETFLSSFSCFPPKNWTIFPSLHQNENKRGRSEIEFLLRSGDEISEMKCRVSEKQCEDQCHLRKRTWIETHEHPPPHFLADGLCNVMSFVMPLQLWHITEWLSRLTSLFIQKSLSESVWNKVMERKWQTE